jgi:hypothetical protein
VRRQACQRGKLGGDILAALIWARQMLAAARSAWLAEPRIHEINRK